MIIPVVVLVDVPGEVADPGNTASAAVRNKLVSSQTATGPGHGTDVKMLDGSYAYCQFHTVGELNQLLRAGVLTVAAR